MKSDVLTLISAAAQSVTAGARSDSGIMRRRRRLLDRPISRTLKPESIDEIAAIAIDALNDRYLEVSKVRPFFWHLVEAYCDRFKSYPFDTTKALCSDLEMRDFPEEELRNIIHKLDQVYLEKYGESLLQPIADDELEAEDESAFETEYLDESDYGIVVEYETEAEIESEEGYEASAEPVADAGYAYEESGYAAEQEVGAESETPVVHEFAPVPGFGETSGYQSEPETQQQDNAETLNTVVPEYVPDPGFGLAFEDESGQPYSAESTTSGVPEFELEPEPEHGEMAEYQTLPEQPYGAGTIQTLVSTDATVPGYAESGYTEPDYAEPDTATTAEYAAETEYETAGEQPVEAAYDAEAGYPDETEYAPAYNYVTASESGTEDELEPELEAESDIYAVAEGEAEAEYEAVPEYEDAIEYESVADYEPRPSSHKPEVEFKLLDDDIRELRDSICYAALVSEDLSNDKK